MTEMDHDFPVGVVVEEGDESDFAPTDSDPSWWQRRLRNFKRLMFGPAELTVREGQRAVVSTAEQAEIGEFANWSQQQKDISEEERLYLAASPDRRKKHLTELKRKLKEVSQLVAKLARFLTVTGGDSQLVKETQEFITLFDRYFNEITYHEQEIQKLNQTRATLGDQMAEYSQRIDREFTTGVFPDPNERHLLNQGNPQAQLKRQFEHHQSEISSWLSVIHNQLVSLAGVFQHLEQTVNWLDYVAYKRQMAGRWRKKDKA